MKDPAFRYVLRNEIMFAAETAERLEVSKQRLNAIVMAQELIPFKTSSSGTLFLREDVEEYIKRKQNRNEPLLTMPYLYCLAENTQKSVSFALEQLNQMSSISAVFIFFSTLDAVLHNFYVLSDHQPTLGELQDITVPHMIIRDSDGREMWLGGCNCGYGGEGPHGSESVLEYLGLSSELIEPIFTHDVVQYYRTPSGWDINARPSHFDRRREGLTIHNGNASLSMHRGQLVLLKTGPKFPHDSDSDLITLERYQAFIPNPIELTIYKSKEEAIAGGFYDVNRQWEYRGTRTYRVIIRDQSGRQLWLDPPISEKEPIGQQERLVNILKYCGFEIPKNNSDSRLNQWINSIIKQTPPRKIVLTRRGYMDRDL